MTTVTIKNISFSPTPGSSINCDFSYDCNGTVVPVASGIAVNPDGTLVTPVDITYDETICASPLLIVESACGKTYSTPFSFTTTTTTTTTSTTTTSTSTSTTSTTTAPTTFDLSWAMIMQGADSNSCLSLIDFAIITEMTNGDYCAGDGATLIHRANYNGSTFSGCVGTTYTAGLGSSGDFTNLPLFPNVYGSMYVGSSCSTLTVNIKVTDLTTNTVVFDQTQTNIVANVNDNINTAVSWIGGHSYHIELTATST